MATLKSLCLFVLFLRLSSLPYSGLSITKLVLFHRFRKISATFTDVSYTKVWFSHHFVLVSVTCHFACSDDHFRFRVLGIFSIKKFNSFA